MEKRLNERAQEESRMRFRDEPLRQWVRLLVQGILVASQQQRQDLFKDLHDLDRDRLHLIFEHYPDSAVCLGETIEQHSRSATAIVYLLGKELARATSTGRSFSKMLKTPFQEIDIRGSFLQQLLMLMHALGSGKTFQRIHLNRQLFKSLLVCIEDDYHLFKHNLPGRSVLWDQHFVAEEAKVREIKNERLLRRTPVFYHDDETALRDVDLPHSVLSKLPKDAIATPSVFIEHRTKEISRAQAGFARMIMGLLMAPYDISRVRKHKGFVFKRVDLHKVRYGTEEIDQAKAVQAVLKEHKDPRFTVQNFLGSIYDRGNIYLVSEYVSSSRTLVEDSRYDREFHDLKELVQHAHVDLVPRNVLVQKKPGRKEKFVVIDFETKPQQ